MALPIPGQQFEGKYVVDEHIGSGGFAEVYRAHDEAGRAVAIKILVPVQAEWAQNDPIVERFEREGELLGRLTNEHTVTMIEMGRTKYGAPYIVFEYVDGADLAQILEQSGPLPPARVVKILQQVCSALGEAHNLGVMHRDIKPANIMVYSHLGVQGLVKLLDFGIAKPTEGISGNQDLTSVGMVLGTPRYMAPEQFTGARAAPTSDIYSLGLVAYELVVGRMAVDAETTTGIFRQQLSPDEFKLPRTVAIPPGLRRVITKMTRKTRADRYQTVQEVLHDLENLDRVDVAPIRASGGSSRKLLAILAVLGFLIVLAGSAALMLILPGDDSDSDGTEVTRPEEPDEPPEVDDAPVPRVARLDPTPKEPSETSETPTPQQPNEVPGMRGSAPAPARYRVPTDAEGKPMPPPEDDIEPLDLGSAARVKSVATRALTMGDWDKVIAACKPHGTELTFCARWLADAYRSRGDISAACYWYEVIGEQKTGLSCPYEEKLN